MHNVDIRFFHYSSSDQTCAINVAKLLNQSIPFNICHTGLGPIILAMTFHICKLYTFWDILLLQYYFLQWKSMGGRQNRPPILSLT